MKTISETKDMTLDDALKLASGQMNSKNYRAAHLILEDVLKSVPNNFDSLYIYGLAKYYLGDLFGAIRVLKKATEQDLVTEEAWCNLGAFLAQTGDYKNAVMSFDKAILINSNFADSYWNKSNALYLDGNYKDAIKTGRKSIALSPEKPEAWNNLAMALARTGENDEAIKHLKKAISLRSTFTEAWNNLGNLLRELSQPKEAEKKCSKALEFDPLNVQAMNNLGNALFDQYKIDDAETWYRKAISIKPEYAEAHNNLSTCLIEKQRFDEAIIEAKYATLFEKGYADAYINMGRALKYLGEFEKSEEAIQQATLLYPTSMPIKIELADILLSLGKSLDANIVIDEIDNAELTNSQEYLHLSTVLDLAGETERAIIAAEKAIELSPESPLGYINKGQISHISGDIKTAEDNYNKALDLNKNFPLLYMYMAEVCQSKGDIKNAEIYIRKAQKLSPNLPLVYNSLSKIKKFSKNDNDLKKMLSLEKKIKNINIDGAVLLYFALFSAHHDIKEYSKAFSYLKLANDYKKKTIIYNRDEQEIIFAKIKKDFTKESINKTKDFGYNSNIPVFILGMPRSGTTLTEQILAAHPNVYAAGELMDFGKTEKEFDNKITQDNCKDFGKAYIKKLKNRDETGTALRITDKMPGNFMYIGHIISTLPKAKIIHCRRNPIDICLSCYKQNFARGQSWSYSLKDIAEQYRLYEDLMAYWKNIFPEKFINIDYEDTVNSLETQARKIINYVELEWNDACLEPHKYNRPILTASKIQVKKPVYNTSVNSWKIYETELKDLIKELNL